MAEQRAAALLLRHMLRKHCVQGRHCDIVAHSPNQATTPKGKGSSLAWYSKSRASAVSWSMGGRLRRNDAWQHRRAERVCVRAGACDQRRHKWRQAGRTPGKQKGQGAAGWCPTAAGVARAGMLVVAWAGNAAPECTACTACTACHSSTPSWQCWHPTRSRRAHAGSSALRNSSQTATMRCRQHALRQVPQPSSTANDMSEQQRTSTAKHSTATQSKAASPSHP